MWAGEVTDVLHILEVEVAKSQYHPLIISINTLMKLVARS